MWKKHQNIYMQLIVDSRIYRLWLHLVEKFCWAFEQESRREGNWHCLIICFFQRSLLHETKEINVKFFCRITMSMTLEASTVKSSRMARGWWELTRQIMMQFHSLLPGLPCLMRIVRIYHAQVIMFLHKTLHLPFDVSHIPHFVDWATLDLKIC